MNLFKRKKKSNSDEHDIILQAVEQSAAIEGLSLQRAQKNTKVLEQLRKNGKTFSL